MFVSNFLYHRVYGWEPIRLKRACTHYKQTTESNPSFSQFCPWYVQGQRCFVFSVKLYGWERARKNENWKTNWSISYNTILQSISYNTILQTISYNTFLQTIFYNIMDDYGWLRTYRSDVSVHARMKTQAAKTKWSKDSCLHHLSILHVYHIIQHFSVHTVSYNTILQTISYNNFLHTENLPQCEKI